MVAAFRLVKNSTQSLICALYCPPNKEPLVPPKGRYGMEAGTPTFTPSIPELVCRKKSCAMMAVSVKMQPPLPVFGFVDDVDAFLVGFGFYQCNNRAENFFFGNAHIFGDTF